MKRNSGHGLRLYQTRPPIAYEKPIAAPPTAIDPMASPPTETRQRQPADGGEEADRQSADGNETERDAPDRQPADGNIADRDNAARNPRAHRHRVETAADVHERPAGNDRPGRVFESVRRTIPTCTRPIPAIAGSRRRRGSGVSMTDAFAAHTLLAERAQAHGRLPAVREAVHLAALVKVSGMLTPRWVNVPVNSVPPAFSSPE